MLTDLDDILEVACGFIFCKLYFQYLTCVKIFCASRKQPIYEFEKLVLKSNKSYINGSQTLL